MSGNENKIIKLSYGNKMMQWLKKTVHSTEQTTAPLDEYKSVVASVNLLRFTWLFLGTKSDPQTFVK